MVIFKRIWRMVSFSNKKKTVDVNSIEYLRIKGGNIGENVHILSSHMDADHAFLLSIGNNVTITHATVLAHDASTKKELGYTKMGCIDIGNDVFIGWGSIILPNTRIGNKVIIGAGAVVAHDIPDNSVVCGNPCKIVCTYDEYMEKQRNIMKKSQVYEYPLREYSIEEQKRCKSNMSGNICFEG